MIVLDTTVLVHVVGGEHPLREPARSLVAAVGVGTVPATTTVEVIQELVHARAGRRGRRDAAGLGRAYAELLSPLLDLGEDDLHDGLALFERDERLGSFEAVLAAAALRRGARALVSADTAFAGLSGLPFVDLAAHGVTALLAGLLDAGHAAAVVELAEHCMKRLDTALGNLDDSSGHLAAPAERLCELHQAASLAARPDQRALGRRLADWALTDTSDLSWFANAPTRYADVLGDEGLDAFRECVEPEWAALPALPPARERPFGGWDKRRYVVTRLREELARAGGSVDELVAVLAHDLSSAHQFERIADALEAGGREREALAWLERGNAVHAPAGDSSLRPRIVAAYLRDGQVEDAVELAERGHEHTTSVATYLELRTAAEALGDWAERRPAALERLRGADRYGGRSSAVRAQLAEGDLDGAWADARAAGCDGAAWLELAEASRGARPDDAAGVYRKLLEEALERADDTGYKRTVDLLQRWRATLELHGREAELTPEVAAIRERYGRRTRLLTRMDRAGLTGV